jgi:hypothetical protein
MTESFEADTSLYRVRSPYVNAIDSLLKKHSFVKYVDMYSLISDEYYLDHCHPLPAGQKILADAISEKLEELGITGDDKAQIKNILYNPEFSNGNKSFFHDYFKTFAPYTETEISNQIDVLREAYSLSAKNSPIPQLSSSTREIKTAIEYYLRHPFFTSFEDILRFPPRFPSDIGRFPEYFVIRQMIPYVVFYESFKETDTTIAFENSILRSSNDLLSILPEECRTLIDKESFKIDLAYEEQRIENILLKVKKLLLEHLLLGNQIFNRTKSTIFWYVRETLRFGSHSRFSMRYDRILLEYLAEGLLVTKILNYHLDNKYSIEINDLVKALNNTVSIHDNYCSKFNLSDDNLEQLMNYDQALSNNYLQLISKKN